MTRSAAALYGQVQGGKKGTWSVNQTEFLAEGTPVGIASTPTGRPALLVPASGRRAEVKLRTKGLLAKVGALAPARDGKFFDWLMVTCLDERFDSTFFLLCDEVLAQLSDIGSTPDQVSVTMSVVERWQDLLSAVGSDLLTDQQVAGLLAELHALEEIGRLIGPDAALGAWAGPDKARVDFRFPQSGIEVKATLQRERFNVAIHGMWQLDSVEVGVLHLFAQQFEKVPSGGDSIPDAVERLERQGIPRQEFWKALAGVGYLKGEEELYRAMRYKVLAERGLRVGDATPRIVRSSFADERAAEAVSHVAYTIDLTDLQPEQGRLNDARDVFTEGVR